MRRSFDKRMRGCGGFCNSGTHFCIIRVIRVGRLAAVVADGNSYVKAEALLHVFVVQRFGDWRGRNERDTRVKEDVVAYVVADGLPFSEPVPSEFVTIVKRSAPKLLSITL